MIYDRTCNCEGTEQLRFTDIIEKKVTELNKRNYQKELDKLIDNIKKRRKSAPYFLLTVACSASAAV